MLKYMLIEQKVYLTSIIRISVLISIIFYKNTCVVKNVTFILNNRMQFKIDNHIFSFFTLINCRPFAIDFRL